MKTKNFYLFIFGMIFLIGGVSASYTNQTDGFSTSEGGVSGSTGIVTNNSDFWVIDNGDIFVYHLNHTGGNYTDVNNGGAVSSINSIGDPGFSVSAAGVSNPWGLATNGSDFWITDITFNSPFVYHYNAAGVNQTDSFSPSTAGVSNLISIAINVTSGKPYNFWLIDNSDDFVYHFASSCICPVGANQNWQIDMSEACVITTNCNLGTGKLNFTNSGSATCSAIINTTDMGIPPSGATVFITSAGRLNVY